MLLEGLQSRSQIFLQSPSVLLCLFACVHGENRSEYPKSLLTEAASLNLSQTMIKLLLRTNLRLKTRRLSKLTSKKLQKLQEVPTKTPSPLFSERQYNHSHTP